MSYIVVLLALPPSTTLEDLRSGRVEPISPGSKDDVIRVISTVLPEVEWFSPPYGQLVAGDFVIEFNIGQEDRVDHVGLRILGGGDIFPTIQKLCSYAGWQAFDAQTGDFMDFEQESEKSWQAWQEYRDRIINSLDNSS